jgi:plasmid stabilization system protein ParE
MWIMGGQIVIELFWTPEAIHDRDDIYSCIEADNPAAALALDPPDQPRYIAK